VLLQAALRWFARHGFEGTSLRAIAAEAGVDMALVSRLFGSKGNLWDAVIANLADRQSGQRTALLAIKAMSEKDPAAGFREFIRHFAQVSYEMPEFPALLVQEAANPGSRLDTILERLVTPFRLECQPIIAAVHKAGVIRVGDPVLFFGMLLSAIAVPMVSPSMFSRTTQLTEELRDSIADEAIRMFMR
jgi:AcrR family transcriptional regulator